MSQIADDDVANAVQFFGGEAIVIGQDDVFEPELTGRSIATHMDMPRLLQSKL